MGNAAQDLSREERTLTREQIVEALHQHTPSNIAATLAPRRSAVAAVLRFDRPSPQVLLMKRAPRDGDRWSGHISFPGGMEEPRDPDLLSTAIRETQEEVGIDLRTTAHLIGRLDDRMAVAKGKVLPMAIRPYVFEQHTPAPLHLGIEAESTFWLPLAEAASSTLSGWLPYNLGPVTTHLPCWRYDGYTIWGLTYQMLKNLLMIVGAG